MEKVLLLLVLLVLEDEDSQRHAAEKELAVVFRNDRWIEKEPSRDWTPREAANMMTKKFLLRWSCYKHKKDGTNAKIMSGCVDCACCGGER
jgi:hypothetical protein